MNYENKKKLKKEIDRELLRYHEVVRLSPEFSAQSIMMDQGLISVKNEVLKKVKIFKMKKASLPDFVR